MKPRETFAAFLNRAIGSQQVASFWRRSRTDRTNAKTDHAALGGWLAAVRLMADKKIVAGEKRPAAEKLARKLARLSVEPDGPMLAVSELARVGIVLVALEHLPGTYLEGPALCRADGTPVIALTLRHDRIDNFWFTLLHELCHVLKHIDRNNSLILDDLELKGEDDTEAEEIGGRANPGAVRRKVGFLATIYLRSREKRRNPTVVSLFELAQALDASPGELTREP